MQTYEQNEWVIHIAGRLLSNDSAVLSLMDHNPFQGRATPRWTHYTHVQKNSTAAVILLFLITHMNIYIHI